MFYASDRGGRTGAVLASFVASCNRLGIDSFAYLRDAFARIGLRPQHQLDVSVGVTEFHDYRSEPSCRQALQQKATPASGRGLESPTLLASSNANSPGREKIRTSSQLARVSMSSRLAGNRG